MVLWFPRAKQGLCHTKHGGAWVIILWALRTVFLIFLKWNFHSRKIMKLKWNKQKAKRRELTIIGKHLQSACYNWFLFVFYSVGSQILPLTVLIFGSTGMKSHVSVFWSLHVAIVHRQTACLYVCLYTFTCLTSLEPVPAKICP